VRNGDNKQVAVLAIARIEATLTVGQERQESAADRQGPSFGRALTRDQIEALSDDPATLQQQLQDMAGPGAVIRIDGFEGSALPAKAQIRSIFSRDQFAAEYHNAGGTSIEIITQPGLGPIRYYSNFAVRNGALSGRSPFVPVRGPEQFMLYGFGAGGGLIKDKASFNLNVFGNSSYDTPNLNVALPTGKISIARTRRRITWAPTRSTTSTRFSRIGRAIIRGGSGIQPSPTRWCRAPSICRTTSGCARA
jgi:hypothetical protein